MADQSPTITNYHRPLDDYWPPTTDFSLQPVVGSLADQNECDHTIFGVTVIADGFCWFLLVGDKFGRRWSANGRNPSVTGPLHEGGDGSLGALLGG